MMANQRDFGFPSATGYPVLSRKAAMLDQISRSRPLTEAESRSLQEALRRMNRDRNGSGRVKRALQRPWRRADDLELVALLMSGKKPRHIAKVVSRSERAVWRRMFKLRLRVREITKGSIPGGKAGE